MDGRRADSIPWSAAQVVCHELPTVKYVEYSVVIDNTNSVLIEQQKQQVRGMCAVASLEQAGFKLEEARAFSDTYRLYHTTPIPAQPEPPGPRLGNLSKPPLHAGDSSSGAANTATALAVAVDSGRDRGRETLDGDPSSFDLRSLSLSEQLHRLQKDLL